MRGGATPIVGTCAKRTLSKEPNVEFAFDLTRESQAKREFARAAKSSARDSQTDHEDERETEESKLAVTTRREMLETTRHGRSSEKSLIGVDDGFFDCDPRTGFGDRV
jgi:hypothetical protein